MTKKNEPTPKANTAALTHNPFAALASRSGTAGDAAHPGVIRVPWVKPNAAPKPLPPVKLSLRLETAGRSGKVVTRIRGLPLENIEAIAARLRKALGCGATVEGSDVLLLGTLADRASQWLDGAGDLRTMTAERAPVSPVAVPAATQATGAPAVVGKVPYGSSMQQRPDGNRASGVSSASTLPSNAGGIVGTLHNDGGNAGTRRSDVRRGLRVAIVQKADQSSGKLTEGIVQELLTSSPTHPRGIKVRLESGEVGRVRTIFG